MTTSSMRAKRVRIRVKEGRAGLFYASSPDMKGLLVAEPTINELEEAIPRAIRDMYAARDVNVVVAKMEDDDERFSPWVAIAAEVAKMALKPA